MKTIVQNEQDIEMFIKQNIDLTKNQIITLIGDLGAGKTTFVKEIAKKLGIKDQVNSPTFIIQNEYNFLDGKLFHIDLYRLQSENEFSELKIENLLKDRFIICIEWANKFPQQIKDIATKHNILVNELQTNIIENEPNKREFILTQLVSNQNENPSN